MVKPYCIYGCSLYYIYGQILLHLWTMVIGFIRFVVNTFKISITFMVNSNYIYGWYYICGF